MAKKKVAQEDCLFCRSHPCQCFSTKGIQINPPQPRTETSTIDDDVFDSFMDAATERGDYGFLHKDDAASFADYLIQSDPARAQRLCDDLAWVDLMAAQFGITVEEARLCL